LSNSVFYWNPTLQFVTPAQAGVQKTDRLLGAGNWIPACAGMTGPWPCVLEKNRAAGQDRKQLLNGPAPVL
jgi:hypothetical protein